MATEHGIISATEAHQRSQAVQAEVIKLEVPKIVGKIMGKIASGAERGSTAANFSLFEIYADGNPPSAASPDALIDRVVEALSAKGYNVGADKVRRSIMIGWQNPG